MLIIAENLTQILTPPIEKSLYYRTDDGITFKCYPVVSPVSALLVNCCKMKDEWGIL